MTGTGSSGPRPETVPDPRDAVDRRQFLRTAGTGALAVGVGVGGTAVAGGTASASEHEAEVYRDGGTWYADAHGSTVYSGGDDVFEALRAAVDGLTAGRTSTETVVLQDDASASLRGNGVELPSYTELDLRGTIELVDAGGIPIYADGVESIAISNYALVGPADMGMRIRRASDVRLGSIELEMPAGGIGIRIDDGYNDGSPITTEDVTIEDVTVDGCGGHAVETYGVDGIEVGTVETYDSGGCGLLLNDTANASVAHVDATRADVGGGYAGFRCANDAGPNITVERVDAVGCGRGVFTVSNSSGITIEAAHLEACGSGALIQDTRDVTIAGGTIVDNVGEGVRIDSRNSSEHHHTRDVTLENLAIENNGDWGVRETGPDTEQNAIRNNAFCENAAGAVETYADSTVVSGNSYDCSGSVDPCEGATPTPIEPHLRVDGGEWQNADAVEVEPGSVVEFGPHPTEGGAWSWDGPGASASTREIEVSPDETSTYVATFTNDCGEPSTRKFTVTVDDSGTEACPGAEASEELSNGDVVCDVDGDGQYRDVTGDGSVTNSDVTEFFGTQHVDPWNSRPDRFDFTGDDAVTQADVIELFRQL